MMLELGSRDDSVISSNGHVSCGSSVVMEVSTGPSAGGHVLFRSATSLRVYRATISPCFHRPWRCTAALGAPAVTIRRAIPMRPLCPLNPSPRPAAWAAARTRLARVSPVSPTQGAGGGLGHCHGLRLRLVLALPDGEAASAVGSQLHVAPGQGGGLGAPEPAVGQDPDDGQVQGGAARGGLR